MLQKYSFDACLPVGSRLNREKSGGRLANTFSCIDTDRSCNHSGVFPGYRVRTLSGLLTPAYWSNNNVPANFLFARGFTGHEHLDGFNLINMNSRVYDPYLGRFLSPDVYIQNPSNTQSYNRYAFCFNNPLKYTDPTGNLISSYNYACRVTPEINNWKKIGFERHYGFPKLLRTKTSIRNTFEENIKDLPNLLDWLKDYSPVDFLPSITIVYVIDMQSGKIYVYDGDTGECLGEYIPEVVVYSGQGGSETDNSYLYFAGWSALTQWTRVVSKAQVRSLTKSQAILKELHGVSSILINSKITTFLKIGQTAKFLGFAGNLAGMVPTGINIYNNGLNIENSLDFMAGATSFVPVFGWVISPLYKGVINDIPKNPGYWSQAFDTYTISPFNCFVEGTKVLMGEGIYKNIESIKIGDTVLTYNFGEKKIEKNTVLKIDAPIHNKLVKIVFSNGVEVISTEDHPYYVKGKGWSSLNPELTFQNYGIEVEKIEISDLCLTTKGNKLKKVKVVNIVTIEKSIKTYNLTRISNSNNYFANGILVNNESAKMPLNDKMQMK
ncbi:MAG: hypothetical protein JW973_08785 [Bacteroidales bacterium]|nr:hypothetical protein [Bacteroidales bacterium]